MEIFSDLDPRALILFGVILVLFFLYARGLKKQKRKLSSGETVASDRVKAAANCYRFDMPFHITRANKWCRVSVNGHIQSESEEGFNTGNIEYPCLKYHLQIRDVLSDRVLHEEKRCLTDFVAFMKNRGITISSLFKERSSSTRIADQLPILEFMLRHSGEYRLTFQIQAEEEKKMRGFRASAKISSMSLTIKEDVEPMRARAYPHRKIEI